LVFLRAGRHVVQIPYEEFERWVREGRIHDRVEVHFEPVTGSSWVKAGELELYRSLVDDERARFQRQFSMQQFPWVTFVFVFLCVAYFAILAVEMVQRGATPVQLLQTPRFDLLVEMGAKEGAHMIELGQWWRLLTFSFLHAGLIHLVPNMLYTAYVGWSVESVYGRSGAIVIFLFSALGCGAASLMVSPIPSVGASGITFGLFAAAVVFGWKYEPLIPPGYTKKFGWAFFPFLAVFLVLGFRSALVDNWGHVGGVIGGGAAAFALSPAVVQDKLDRWNSAKFRAYLVTLMIFGTIFGVPQVIGPNALLVAPRLNLEVVHDVAGLAFSLPRYWARPKVRDAFPYDAFTSPSKAMAVSYGVDVQEYPVHPDEIAGHFLDELRGVPGYEVIYDSLSEQNVTVGEVTWRVISVTVEEGTERRIYQRAASSRGCVEYRLTFQTLPKHVRAYEGLRQRILETTRVTYPRAIREGEDKVKFYPEFWKQHSDLGRAYALYGEAAKAEEALLRARTMAPEMDEPLFWLLFLYDRYNLQQSDRYRLVEEAFDRHATNPDMLMLCYEVCRTMGNRGCEWRALSLANASYPNHPKIQAYVEEFGGVEALLIPADWDPLDDGDDDPVNPTPPAPR
jgi:rhomboid protease GluP